MVRCIYTIDVCEVGTDLRYHRCRKFFESLAEARIAKVPIMNKWKRRIPRSTTYGVYCRILKRKIHKVSNKGEKYAMYEVSDTEYNVEW